MRAFAAAWRLAARTGAARAAWLRQRRQSGGVRGVFPPRQEDLRLLGARVKQDFTARPPGQKPAR